MEATEGLKIVLLIIELEYYSSDFVSELAL